MTLPLRRFDPVWRWVTDDPDRISLSDDDTTWSARDIVAAARSVARACTAAGLRPGDALAVRELGPADTVVTALGALARGIDVVTDGSPVPAEARPAGRRCGCRVVVANDETACCEHDAGASPGPFVAERSGRLLPDASPRTPPPDAAATAAAMFGDVVGIPYGPAVVLALPHRHRFTVTAALGLLHSRRHVVMAGADSDRLRASVATAGAVVATPRVLASLGAATLAGVERVVSIGAPSAELRDALGPALVEHVFTNGIRDVRAAANETAAGFWSIAERRPAHLAVTTGEGLSVTAAELRDRAVALAGTFARLPSRAVVVAALHDGVDTLAAYLAACLAGVELLTADPDAAAREIAYYRDATGAALVLVDERTADHVPAGVAATRIDGAAAPFDMEPVVAAGGILGHTSGTTGPPKVVTLTPRAMSPRMVAAVERATGAMFGMAHGGRHLVTGRLHEGAPLYFASLALHSGETLVLTDRWSPRAALDLLEGATSAFMAPSMFSGLLALPPALRDRTFPSLRSVVHATAACPPDVKRAMSEWWGPVLVDCYSPTEALGTYALFAEWSERPGTVGRPLPGAAVHVRDAAGRRCAPGVEGDVFLLDPGSAYADGSSPVGRGDGWVCVGDVGRLDEDGWLYLTGRTTDYVNVGGTKFHPAPVEQCLVRVAGVRECAVLGAPHPRLGQVAVAVVVTDSPGPGLRSELLRHARAELPIVQVPARVVFVDAMPDAPDRTALRRSLAAIV